MRALPSYWNGVVFRSRTEARWAVFFDAINLVWDYEPEGFALPNDTWYLPDFWLPEMHIWAEVKPRDLVSEEERERVEMLVAGTGHPCLLLEGTPRPTAFDYCMPEAGDVAWDRACFNDKHTVSRHDGRPRMYLQPADYEPPEQEVVVAAMNHARSKNLTDPDEANVIPTGWEGIPLVNDAA